MRCWPIVQTKRGADVLGWSCTSDLYGRGDPSTCYATAGMVIWITKTHKPYRHDRIQETWIWSAAI